VKSQLRSWLAGAEFQRVVAASVEHNRIINILIALTYEADPLIAWRAIDAIGRCAARLSAIRPEHVKGSLRRLFWMMSDESGAVAWHAPEAIGEIIHSDPHTFAEFIPMTISLLDMEPEDRPRFLPGVLYALGRIGEVAANSVDACLPSIFDALSHVEVQTRAMAVCCLGRLKARNLLLQHPELARDSAKALIYRDGELVETTISLLRADALKIH
jgi:hypothetical protein